MPTLTWVTSGDSSGQISAAQYDEMAADHAASNAEDAYNAYYERPAMIAMLSDVAGRRVLNAGCGSGALAAWLAENGATVTAFDGSGEMAALARRRLGEDADIHVADLARPLTFAPNQTFDLVAASLVLHYVRDWVAVFREFRRVLAPGGAVVFSTHHPFMDWQLDGVADYFGTRQITETWRKGNGEYEVTFWRRPLSVMFEDIRAGGFTVDELAEPAPLRGAGEHQPVRLQDSYEQTPVPVLPPSPPVTADRDTAAVARSGAAPPDEQHA